MDVGEGPAESSTGWCEYRAQVYKVLVPSILMSETRVELSHVS